MAKQSERSLPVLGTIAQLIAFKCNLLAGFVIGLIASVAAIGAMVALIRLMTGKVPFLAHIVEAPGDERQLSLALIPLDQAGELFAQHKQRLSDGLGSSLKATLAIRYFPVCEHMQNCLLSANKLHCDADHYEHKSGPIK